MILSLLPVGCALVPESLGLRLSGVVGAIIPVGRKGGLVFRSCWGRQVRAQGVTSRLLSALGGCVLRPFEFSYSRPGRCGSTGSTVEGNFGGR